MKGLENQLFQLKFTAKQLQKQSKRCQKEELQEKVKLQNALKKGQTEAAQIYAQNCIRKKNEALNLLRLSSRIDGVASRVQSAITMKAVSSSMASVVKNMEKSMSSMDLEKLGLCMDKFELQVETLDIQEQQMIPTEKMDEQVDQLLNEMMEEKGNDVHAQLDQLHPIPTNLPQATTIKQASKDTEDDILEKRLQALRG
ncbi:unnamed protein product [Cunninghamella echinulata]